MSANVHKPVGAMLRDWRERRRLSQLQLALQTEISARHLSFIETGRAKPSRETLVRLGEQLDVPLGERNGLLLAAGFAPAYSHLPLEAPAMAPIREVLDAVLRIPFPALIVDRRWNVVQSNEAALAFNQGIAPALLSSPVNALRVALHPNGLAPRIVNFNEWRSYLLTRLRREAAVSGDPELAALYAELCGYAPEGATGTYEPAATEIAVVLRLRDGDRERRFINTIATFGTPVDVTVADLMIETFYPIDGA